MSRAAYPRRATTRARAASADRSASAARSSSENVPLNGNPCPSSATAIEIWCGFAEDRELDRRSMCVPRGVDQRLVNQQEEVGHQQVRDLERLWLGRHRDRDAPLPADPIGQLVERVRAGRSGALASGARRGPSWWMKNRRSFWPAAMIRCTCDKRSSEDAGSSASSRRAVCSCKRGARSASAARRREGRAPGAGARSSLPCRAIAGPGRPATAARSARSATTSPTARSCSEKAEPIQTEQPAAEIIAAQRPARQRPDVKPIA